MMPVALNLQNATLPFLIEALGQSHSMRHMNLICNSYTMHAKAASVLSARARGRELIKTDAACACMVQMIYSLVDCKLTENVSMEGLQ